MLCTFKATTLLHCNYCLYCNNLLKYGFISKIKIKVYLLYFGHVLPSVQFLLSPICRFGGKCFATGPNLEFEHLERELANSSGWPPLGKNNDVKIGRFLKPVGADLSMYSTVRHVVVAPSDEYCLMT
jgi:hypothetical protein